MKNAEVQIGSTYMAKVSGVVVPVEIFCLSKRGGWWATNTKTNRSVHIKSARRLRGAA